MNNFGELVCILLDLTSHQKFTNDLKEQNQKKGYYAKNFTGNTFLIGQSNCTVHYILPENNLYPPTN